MTPPVWLRLLALACLAPSVLVLLAWIADERTRYSILTSAAVSALGFALTLRLIPLTKAYTLKAGLSGLDINKKGSREGQKKVPESLGLASGVVFLVRRIAGCHDVPADRCRRPCWARHAESCLLARAHCAAAARPRRHPGPLLQICIVLFQQLHYYDTPSLVRSLRAGNWREALGGTRATEPVSDAWCVPRRAASAPRLAPLLTLRMAQAGGLQRRAGHDLLHAVPGLC